jgi:hypothetical protein
MNERISSFALPTLYFERYPIKHLVFLASSSLEHQKKLPIYSNPAIPHEKYHLLLDMDFLVKESIDLIQNFT